MKSASSVRSASGLPASRSLDRCACTVLLVSLGILVLPVLLGVGLRQRQGPGGALRRGGKGASSSSSVRLKAMMEKQSFWAGPADVKGGRPEMVMDERSMADSAHGSTLVSTPEGGIVCAWFGGSREGARDVTINIASRSPEGHWEPAAEAAKVSNEAHWNPVLFWYPAPSKADPQGKLWLQFKVGNRIPHWRTYVTSSTDVGRTWAPPSELVQGDRRGGRGCVKNKPLVVEGGSGPMIVAGASLEDGTWRAFMDISEDGVAWEAGEVVPVADRGVGIIQPTLWQSGERSVHAMFRSDEGHVYRADSKDGGRTWGRGAYRTSLPNNNSGLDVAKLRDGTLLLAYNPKSNDARYPLRISLSEDNGSTWSLFWDVETQPGEFSYPAIIPWEDHAKGPGFALSYTYNRDNIGFVSMSLEDFRSRASQLK